MSILTYLPVLREIADIWAALTAGAVAGILCLAGAWFLPALRQLFIGLAVACFVATFCFGYGVKQERDVCKAREEVAEQLRTERDALQKKIAEQDAAHEAAGLKDLKRKEDESYEDYVKRLAARKDAACNLIPDDLR